MSLLTTTITTTTAAASAAALTQTPPPRLPHRRPSPLPPLSHLLPLLLLLLFPLHAPHPAFAEVCSRSDQSLRVCLLDVTLTRQSDCSLLVHERLHLRQTRSNTTLFRAIPTVSDQHVTQLRHFRDTIPVSINPPKNRCAADAQQLITIPTIDFTPSKNQDAIQHQLVYRLSNGVNIGSTRCAAPKSPDENEEFNVTFVSDNNNVVRWRSGEWNEKIDRVKVTFVSPGKSLHRMGQGVDEKNVTDSISFSFGTDVNKDDNESDSGKPFGTENREVYFIEFDNSEDAVRCANIRCFIGSESLRSRGGGGVNAGLVIGILAIVIVVLVILWCVVTRVRKRVGNAEGQHGMIFAEGMEDGTGGVAAAAQQQQQQQQQAQSGRRRKRRQQQRVQDDNFPFAI